MAQQLRSLPDILARPAHPRSPRRRQHQRRPHPCTHPAFAPVLLALAAVCDFTQATILPPRRADALPRATAKFLVAEALRVAGSCSFSKSSRLPVGAERRNPVTAASNAARRARVAGRSVLGERAVEEVKKRRDIYT
ncbi:hypothetical protein MSAN_00779600 [Mycena sanguinolenta]|uniref:Uncharacterized protein n=1 Tax=Mycena sanguinolenta TaxID=230812 RepID=A0A8H7DGJ4_9AGAR|nr:hypothetical protein MSAN_00779600 [Mycena sanguinolenta]